MVGKEIFISVIRASGDRAGVFEYEDDVGHFYLYEIHGLKDHKIVSAIPVVAKIQNTQKYNFVIQWDAQGDRVGLFIRGQLWAAFDSKTGVKYGGNYRDDTRPNIPPEVCDAFRK